MNRPDRITVLIADDERSAREELRAELAMYNRFEVIAEAMDGDAAVQATNHYKPDVIFIDIQMPGRSGFEVLESIDEAPVVVFITAYDQYAIHAFEANALDYLTKPVRQERFAQMIRKVEKQIDDMALIMQAGDREKQYFIRDGNQAYFVKVRDIFLLESLGNYSRIYFKDKRAMVKRSLNHWENILPSTFFRISRSNIINKDFIEKIRTMPDSRLTIQLKSGHSLDISSRQSSKFREEHGLE